MREFKDITELERKPELSGSERIPVSSREYTTTGDIAGLYHYDDAELRERLGNIQFQIDKLVEGNADGIINRFREIEAFLAGITDEQTLTGLLLDLRQQIEEQMPKPLNVVAVTQTSLTVSGGNAYHYSGTAALNVTGSKMFVGNTDTSILTVRADVAVSFGAGFDLMDGLDALTGTSTQRKTYTIVRVPVSTGVFTLLVNGAIYGA